MSVSYDEYGRPCKSFLGRDILQAGLFALCLVALFVGLGLALR